MAKQLICAAVMCLAAALTTQAAESVRRVVIYDGKATEVTVAASQSKDLWVRMKDLARATGFVVKPQGICRDELCYPIPKAKKSDFISKKGSASWFNLSEFARLLKQPVATDEKNGVWYFGARPDDRNAYLESLDAPNFTLPDMNGRMHSLSDFKGKKVLLVTWASW
jgi:hypothetical protein